MFSKQHYKAIAEALKTAKPKPEDYSKEFKEFGSVLNQWKFTIATLSRTFLKDNPNFDRDKFHKACFTD